MSNGIYMDFSDLVKGANAFTTLSKEIEDGIDDILTANAIEIEAGAKQRAPVDNGTLRESISTNKTERLVKAINVNVDYAAYMEFGTGVYAAQYVGSLPEDWKAEAAKFRGEGLRQVNITPRPYLYPAYEAQRKQITEDLTTYLNSLKK